MPPPDRYQFDLDTPHPNVDIDSIRLFLKHTLTGVDDAYWLAGLLSELLDTALTGLATATEERQQCRDDIDALTARLDALQPPAPDQEVP